MTIFHFYTHFQQCFTFLCCFFSTYYSLHQLSSHSLILKLKGFFLKTSRFPSFHRKTGRHVWLRAALTLVPVSFRLYLAGFLTIPASLLHVLFITAWGTPSALFNFLSITLTSLWCFHLEVRQWRAPRREKRGMRSSNGGRGLFCGAIKGHGYSFYVAAASRRQQVVKDSGDVRSVWTPDLWYHDKVSISQHFLHKIRVPPPPRQQQQQ